MHVLSKISHTFKPNQAPNVACIVGYIISRMSRPYCKVLCSCTSSQNAKNIHMKYLPRVNFTSLALDKLQNSIPIGYVNKNHDWMYPFHVQTLLSKWNLHNKLSPITLILKMSISRLLYANYLVLLIDRNNIENYLTVIRYYLYVNNGPDPFNL